MYQVVETQEYIEWFNKLNKKEQAQVHARVTKIRLYGYFGDTKKLDSSLAELKWKNGRRVYFTVAKNHTGHIIILLLGGSKNTQSKDITNARKAIRKLSQQGYEDE